MLSSALNVLEIAAHVGLLARLGVSRVKLPVFAAYLVLNLAQGAVLILAASTYPVREYAIIWAYGQLLTALAWVLVSDELRRRVLRGYPGIGSFAAVAVLTAILGAAAIVWFTSIENRSNLMRLAIFVPRIVASTIAVAMLLLLPILKHLNSPLAPNVVIHARLLALYFVARSVTLIIINLGPNPQLVALAGMVLSITCYVVWAIKLTRAGEVVPLTAKPADYEPLVSAEARAASAIATLRHAAR